jgi:hypothetical protein
MNHRPICVLAECGCTGNTALGEWVRKHIFEGDFLVKRLLTTLLPGLLASNVWAATYTYTGATYTSLTNHTTAALGSVGNYLNTMKVTGTLTTAGPLAANLAGANVTAQVTAYSFSDGLATFANSDGNTRLFNNFTVSTDAAGHITSLDVLITRWQSGGTPHVVTNRMEYILISGGGNNVYHNDRCDAVGSSPVGVADTCTSDTADSNSSSAAAVGAGTWVGPVAGGGGSVAAVPTLSEWALLALVSLMAMFGIARTRRRQR